MQDPLGLAVALAMTFGFGAVSGFMGIRRLFQARYLKDTPPSKIRSAAQGYVELSGSIERGELGLLSAPLTQSPCVWWRYRIEQEVKTDRGSRWQVKRSESSGLAFKLNDLTGSCLINPNGALVFSTLRERWHGASPLVGARLTRGAYRFTEERLTEGEFLYAAGEFVTRNQALEYDPKTEAKALIREWKDDYQGLLQRFDANRNGQLEPYEWERVQQAALAHALEMHNHLQQKPDQHHLTRARESQPFVLSTHGKEALVKKLFFQGLGAVVLCLLASLTGIWLVQNYGFS